MGVIFTPVTIRGHKGYSVTRCAEHEGDDNCTALHADPKTIQTRARNRAKRKKRT